MTRYGKYSQIKQGSYDFTLYPDIVVNNTDFYKIVVTSVDRLDLLAKKYYKDSTLWWIIAIANNLDGDSIIVTPGTTLYIPKQRLLNEYI